MSRGCRRSDLDCHPAASSSRVRWSADHRRSSQSRSRRPASQRTSPDSEPSVVEICRLITGRDRAACVHRTRPTLALPDLSQAACTSPGTPHDDAIPVDHAAPFVALARRSEGDLDDPCEGSGRPEADLDRVADDPGGVGRSRSPAFPSSARPRRRREINPPHPP